MLLSPYFYPWPIAANNAPLELPGLWGKFGYKCHISEVMEIQTDWKTTWNMINISIKEQNVLVPQFCTNTILNQTK